MSYRSKLPVILQKFGLGRDVIVDVADYNSFQVIYQVPKALCSSRILRQDTGLENGKVFAFISSQSYPKTLRLNIDVANNCFAFFGV